MLPFILGILLLAVIIGCIVKMAAGSKQHGGRDYMDYFQENERKRKG